MKHWKSALMLATLLFSCVVAIAVGDTVDDGIAPQSTSSRACGDVDGDGSVGTTDMVYLVNYFFSGGPPPPVLADADMDGCPGVTVEDLIFLVEYLFCMGSYPCTGPPCNTTPGGMLTVDHITGLTGSEEIPQGAMLTYRVRMTNDQGQVIPGVSNGFRVYSAVGNPTWSTTTPDTVGIGMGQFTQGFPIGNYSVTGSGADTVSFVGLGICGTGMPDGYDNVAYTIEIGPVTGLAGDVICFDSSWFPPAGEWLWNAGPGDRRIPSWDGPYCFDLVDYICGDVDGDGSPFVDTYDLVYFVDYLFSGGPPPDPLGAADMDGCEGVTVDDMIYLNEFMFAAGPAPCEGPPCEDEVAGEITLDHVDGQLDPGILDIDVPITFYLRYSNTTGDLVSGMTNGFHVYSTTGAQWSSFAGSSTGALGTTEFPNGFSITHFSADGMGADTVGLMAAGGSGSGMAPGFDDVVLTIEIGPIDAAYSGDEICLDSVWFQPVGMWSWGAGAGQQKLPSWDGPHCFEISGPQGECGDLTCDGACNIMDVNRAITYLWGGQWPLACPDYADADDHELFTIHDLACIVRFQFMSGPPLVCPPSLPPLAGPVRDSIFLHTYESAFPSQEYFPADDSTYSVHVHFTTDTTLDCVSLPFHIRVGNEIPIIDSITMPPSGFGTQYYNYTIDQDSGIIVLSGFSVTPDYYLTPGTYVVGKVHLSMAAQDDAWRPITVGWDSLQPEQDGQYVHYPFVTGPNGEVFKPSIYRLPCLQPIRGDMDYNGELIIDIADLVHLVDYMFTGGPPPRCFEEADVMLDQYLQLDISDLVYLVDYMFNEGPAPPPCPEER